MLRKILSLTLSISLLFQYSGFAQSINLADYLSQSHNSVTLDRFRPLALRYFSYEPSVDNFKILLDKGDQKDLSDTKIKNEADRLLTYFKIGLSLPNEKFWVNLRPDAEDRIIDPELEKTDLGKVLLKADLQLKKDTASLTSPQSKEGKAYWEKLYKKAGELFGTENITIPTITRPWIVPGEIIVKESKDSAYIYKAVLKVMLEEDYLSFQPSAISSQQYVFSDPRLKELNKYSTELIKETILPELTKRINSSKDYASLRQVFFSLILARWFKDAFGSSGSIRATERPSTTLGASQSLENSYIKLIDSGDLTDLTSKETWSKTTYFNKYKKSFNEGEYNLSEKIHTTGGQVIRRYTSGGAKIMPVKGAIESFVGNSSPVTRKDMVAIQIPSRAASSLENDRLSKEYSEKYWDAIKSFKDEASVLQSITSRQDRYYTYVKNLCEALPADRFNRSGEKKDLDELLECIEADKKALEFHLRDFFSIMHNYLRELGSNSPSEDIIRLSNKAINFIKSSLEKLSVIESNLRELNKVGSPLVKDKELAEGLSGKLNKDGVNLFGLIEEALEGEGGDFDRAGHQRVVKFRTDINIAGVACKTLEVSRYQQTVKGNDVKYRTMEFFADEFSSEYLAQIKVYNYGRIEALSPGTISEDERLIIAAVIRKIFKAESRIIMEELFRRSGLKYNLVKQALQPRPRTKSVFSVFGPKNGYVDLPPAFSIKIGKIKLNAVAVNELPDRMTVNIYDRRDNNVDSGNWISSRIYPDDEISAILSDKLIDILPAMKNANEIQMDVVDTVFRALGQEHSDDYSKFRGQFLAALNVTKSSSAVEGNNKWAEEFNRFDQRLKNGDEKVLDEIVNFYNGITNDNVKKWELYKWLQNHQSALAAKVMPRIGLCWEGIVPELTAIVKGESGYGNPYASARQLHELYFQETIGGLKAPREVVEAAKNVWRKHGQEFMGYVYPMYAFLNAKFPIVGEGKRPGKLVIVRHGETSWSDSVYNKWAGWRNSLITGKGRDEARKVGEQFKGFKIDLAYSSDLSRAKDTLSEFLAGSQQEDIVIEEVSSLREKSYGALAGWSRADVQKDFGDYLYNQWRRAPKGRAPLGENLEDTKERVGKYLLEEILPAIAAGKNVVISAHGNSLRSLLVILKEHTLARALSDKETEKLEVQLSVPIAISFDNKLNHKEMWSNEHSPAEMSAFLQSGSPLLENKKDEFEKLLAGILSAIKGIKPSKEIDKDLIMQGFKNSDDTRREIQVILKEMDSVSDLKGLREKVNTTIAKLLFYKDAGRIDKEIGKLKEFHASLNADILADRFYRAGLTKSKLEGVTPKDIKPIEIENNFPGLPGAYYLSRYHLLGAIKIEGVDYLVKVSHDEYNTDYKSGRRPHRIMELVLKDKSVTLEPLIRFRVFDDGITPEISYAGHKEPKKKDSDEPAWKEDQRKAFAGLFNIQLQNVDRLQKDLVSDVERILNERAKVFSMGKFVVIGSPADEKLSGLVQRLEQANIALSKRRPGLKVTTPLNLVWVKNRMAANEIASADTIITDPETANKIGESFIPILSSGDAVILQRKKGVSSSLALTEKPEIVGGIDLRQMNMLIQPQGGFASSSLNFSLPELSKAEIEAFDLDKELEVIQRMVSSRIDPIDERLKKYLAVCFARGRTGKDIDELKLCLEDVFISQQLDARKTPDGYKEVIVIADTRRFVLKESRLAAGYGERINLN